MTKKKELQLFDSKMKTHFERYFEVHSKLRGSQMLSRMARHLVLSGWSVEHQVKVASFKILVVGAGGLGCSVALLLSGSLCDNAGITIMDPDDVETTNLHRQLAFKEADVGKPKAVRLSEYCRDRNSDCRVTGIVDTFNANNATELFETHDVVFDCTDNVPTRICISDAWVKTGRKTVVISASCVSWSGQLVSFTRGSRGCLRCIYGENDLSVASCNRLGQCALQGVMGPVVNMMGSHQVMRLISLVKTGLSPSTCIKIQLFDFSSVEPESRTMTIEPNCSLCLTGDIVYATNIASSPAGPVDSSLEIAPSDLLRIITECILIDVREPKHHEISRLENSFNFPASRYVHAGSLCESLPEFPDDEKPIVVVCRRGIDSRKFVNKLKLQTPQRAIFSLKGGLQGIGLDIV